MVKKHGIWRTAVLLCALLVLPAAALADGEQGLMERWNPTGNYVYVTDDSGTLGDQTVFLLQVIPADNGGNRYIGLQERVNHLSMDFSNIAVEFWRTGRNSFDYKMIFYERELDDEGRSAIENGWLLTGVFLRNDSGEFWVTNQQMWLSPGCTNMLAPDPSCVMIGPIPLEDGQIDSKMERGAPASGL